MKDRTFVFGSYEGYRLDSGINFVEAVPSAAACRARRARGAAALRRVPGPGAVVLAGESANPDFDIAAAAGAVDGEGGCLQHAARPQALYELVDYARYFRDQGTNEQPEGVTGRRSDIEANP